MHFMTNEEYQDYAREHRRREEAEAFHRQQHARQAREEQDRRRQLEDEQLADVSKKMGSRGAIPPLGMRIDGAAYKEGLYGYKRRKAREKAQASANALPVESFDYPSIYDV